GIEHVGHHRHVVRVVIDDPAGDGFAIGRVDDDRGVLIADELVGIENLLQHVADAIAAGEYGQVGAGRSAFVVKAMAGEALASPNSFRPRSKSRLASPVSTIRVNSSMFHFLTNGRGFAGGGLAAEIVIALRSADFSSSVFSASLRLATASSRMRLM